jgi:hypothetical protein
MILFRLKIMAYQEWNKLPESFSLEGAGLAPSLDGTLNGH